MRRSVLLSLLAACVFSPSILASPTGLVGERAGRSGFDADALAARGEDTSGTTSTSSDSGSGSLSSALANVSTLPPACSIECQTQVMPVSATTNPKLSDMCDHSAANPKATALQACVLANCTVIEALQAQRFVAELCQVPEVNKAALVMGAIWGFEAFGILGMILRLLAYFVIDGRKFGWDDLVAILILAANVAAGVLVTIATIGYKYGQNIWMLTPNDITNCLKYMITVTPLYIFSTGCLKLALILFYLRIFDKNSGNRYFRILCWFMFAVTVTYTTVHIFTSIFNCWPVQYAWEAWDGLHQGTCGDRSRDGYSHAITNVIVDGILFLLPIPKLWGLNMSWKKKVLVIFMFAFGLFTCVCSIVRVLFMGSNALIGGANGTVTTVPFIICKFLSPIPPSPRTLFPGVRCPSASFRCCE
ncbi:hypothetical protein GGR56DRAFT_400942 [Xylariaceae sp. FL0804]|nr:hypothetical protein GGR56DRAFT_400942 [Xylariaceae sp. FL0804]